MGEPLISVLPLQEDQCRSDRILYIEGLHELVFIDMALLPPKECFRNSGLRQVKPPSPWSGLVVATRTWTSPAGALTAPAALRAHPRFHGLCSPGPRLETERRPAADCFSS